MSKYIKPTDRHAVTGQSINIEATRVSIEPVITNPAATSIKHPGKVNYLGKPKPATVPPAAVVAIKRVEHRVVAKRLYFGSAGKGVAFPRPRFNFHQKQPASVAYPSADLKNITCHYSI